MDAHRSTGSLRMSDRMVAVAAEAEGLSNVIGAFGVFFETVAIIFVFQVLVV